MAQEVLVGDGLSPEMIEAGRQVVLLLDKAQVDVRCALWFLFPEPRVWRLIIATPGVGRVGPKAIYSRVRSALGKAAPGVSVVGVRDIAVADVNAPLVAALRSFTTTGMGLAAIRVTQSSINGVPIDDAFIYRVV